MPFLACNIYRISAFPNVWTSCTVVNIAAELEYNVKGKEKNVHFNLYEYSPPISLPDFNVWLNERLKRQKRLFVISNNNGLVSALWGQPHTRDTDRNTQTHCSHYANVSLSLSKCTLRIEGQNMHFLCGEKVKTFSGIEDISSWKPKNFQDRCALWGWQKRTWTRTSRPKSSISSNTSFAL